jgi:phage tail-like protein
VTELGLLRAFKFRVVMRPSTGGSNLGTGGFQECSGLDVEMDVREHLQGGANHQVIRQIGRAKYTPITLKRGMVCATGTTTNTELWQWFDDIVTGRQPRRYDGLIEVLSGDDKAAATWIFRRGLPQKVTGPQLNAATGAVAIEELQIAHEYLRLVSGKGQF